MKLDRVTVVLLVLRPNAPQPDVVSSDQEPERRAKAAGMNVVSNHRMRTEHERLRATIYRAATPV